MPALHVDGEWYALVESPDSSRIADIDEVILEEFGAKVLGWCVLKEHQKEVGATLLPFAKGEDKLEAITFDSDSNSYWLLKIEPSLNSRLNQARKV